MQGDGAADGTSDGEAAILSDPEWALLAGVRATCSQPADVVARSALLSGAEAYGAFGEGRLAQALESLIAHGALIEVDPERVAVTAAGYAAAMRAPRY